MVEQVPPLHEQARAFSVVHPYVHACVFFVNWLLNPVFSSNIRKSNKSRRETQQAANK